MYRLGERPHSHRRFYIWLLGFVVFLGLLFGLGSHYLKANTQLGQTPAVVTKKINYGPPPLTTFNEELFTIGIPQGWKPATMSNLIPSPTYIWQGTSGDDKSRWISAYVDANMAGFAVNRELHIQASGHNINVISDTSDNCTSFTGVDTQHRATTPAKWEGIDFLCDVGNYERNVVGIVSQDGLNTLAMTGTHGMHHFFFTYTDSSVRPDYTFFTNSLKSFQLK